MLDGLLWHDVGRLHWCYTAPRLDDLAAPRFRWFPRSNAFRRLQTIESRQQRVSPTFLDNTSLDTPPPCFSRFSTPRAISTPHFVVLSKFRAKIPRSWDAFAGMPSLLMFRLSRIGFDDCRRGRVKARLFDISLFVITFISLHFSMQAYRFYLRLFDTTILISFWAVASTMYIHYFSFTDTKIEKAKHLTVIYFSPGKSWNAFLNFMQHANGLICDIKCFRPRFSDITVTYILLAACDIRGTLNSIAQRDYYAIAWHYAIFFGIRHLTIAARRHAAQPACRLLRHPLYAPPLYERPLIWMTFWKHFTPPGRDDGHLKITVTRVLCRFERGDYLAARQSAF